MHEEKFGILVHKGRRDYGTNREFWEVFLKKLSFSDINTIFLDFLLLNIVNAEAHARGFAYLQTFR